ncbi:hypothetical protein CgunFtcFv8_007635 [Champsocephalus gunnari]|uniref:Uncharacterized protein n=1 Tax=Champsocephalus gunnari TaxID=52237 RepID=A0AAN8CHU2_CHAGU|nr:hypothetical protein CgunFtcFv8_007635 [Champsocephalus gunnari]
MNRTFSARMRRGFLPPYGPALAHLHTARRKRRRRGARGPAAGQSAGGGFEEGRGSKGARERMQRDGEGRGSKGARERMQRDVDGGRVRESHCGFSTICQVMKHFVT